jgi:alpha/beta superfamily hydrolase
MTTTSVTIPGAGITLEGALHLPAGDGPFPAVVVCHPHPQYGGDMDSNVVMAVVGGTLAHGVAALRFNFRGVGGSGGRHDGGRGERDDVRAALAWLAARPDIDPARLGLAGYSFGAWMAAAVATEVPARALALVAMPLGRGPDYAAGLAAYPHPLLLVAGDRDPFCDLEALRALAGRLPPSAETHIVPGADHFWWGREGELTAVVGPFIARALA